jgi:HK97 family phage prohead protease
MSPQLEQRDLAEPVEFRAVGNGKRMVAAGVAVRYGAPSKPIKVAGRGAFRERIMPGAARNALEERGGQLYACHEHDRRMLLGTRESGTLRVEDDATELRYEIDLPDTSYGRDLAVSLERGDIRGSSFGFLSLRSAEKWTVGDDGLALRSVGTFALLDHISTTCIPGYPGASTAELALRSLADQRGVEVRAVVDAAVGGTLADIVGAGTETVTLTDPNQDEEKPPAGGDIDDGRETLTVVRRAPITALYL